MQIIMIIAACFMIIITGMVIYDSNRFRKVEYELKSDKIREEFHFLFLSDLHNKQYGIQNEKLLTAIDACNPEAILIGGDILTAHPGYSLDKAIDFIDALADKYPIYYANGNHEQRLNLYPETYGDMGTEYEKKLRQLGIDRLVNQNVIDSLHGINIVGCEIDRTFYKRFQKVIMPGEYLGTILPEKQEKMYTILLAHNPVFFDEYCQWGADLVLSGHVHGGVVKLPLIGGVIGTNFRLFPKYDGGLFRSGDSTMIVSRGLGAHTIPFRLFNPAELVEIVIKKVE